MLLNMNEIYVFHLKDNKYEEFIDEKDHKNVDIENFIKQI
jgi:hypothetical protein